MTRTTEKQLIASLKQMKEIKPRKEWAVLLKSQILTEKKPEIISQPARFANFGSIVSAIFSQRKFAYSLATILILAAGVFGAVKLLPLQTASQKSTASVANSQVAKLDPKAVAGLNIRLKDLTQTLKNHPMQNPQIIKDIAASLKTLADIPGTNLTENPDAQDLYKTLVANQIVDLQKTTLTDEQKTILTEIEDLYSKEKYAEALEKILLINK